MFEFYTIAIIGILGAMSPGPDFIVVSKNAIGHSRSAGYLTAFGIAVGILLHGAYCIFGLAVIIYHSLFLFSMVRYLGALYLIYLGIKNILTNHKKPIHRKYRTVVLSNWQASREGFFINLLNPKCILFILAIFTTVVKPHTIYWIKMIYGFELSLITLFWFSFMTFIFTHHHIKRQIIKIQIVVTKVMGIFLIGLGLDLIISSYR